MKAKIKNKKSKKYQYVDLEPFKGKSGYTVDESELPEFFIVREKGRKKETEDGEIIITQPTHYVPRKLVKKLQRAIKSIDETEFKDGKIPSYIVAEAMLKLLGITRFNRRSGHLNWKLFFGSRKDYFAYFYYPVKVLVWKKEIVHHKQGKISKNPRSENIINQ